jgi:erythromycin esterase
MKTRRLLIVGSLFVGLIFMLILLCMWHYGLHMKHVRGLALLLSGPQKLSAEQKAELHAWLKENAIPLNSVEAGSGFEDMQPLKAMIGDARIVALGEASHLNGDFYKVKHRMVEFLVNEMDFTVFAIEATFAGALELNDYILTGNGEPERALGALVYPAWNTEEVLAMVKWMHEYNSTHERKIKFYGFDNKPATGSAEALYNYLRKTNGTEDYDQILEVLMNPWTAGQLTGGPKEKIYNTAEKIKSLITYLESKQPTYTQQTPSEQDIQGRKEWKLALQHARVLLQNLKFHGESSISTASALRDQNMAQNVRWIMDFESGAKMILWAANSHISATPVGGRSMGYYLRRTYGDDMVIIGLICNRKSSGEPTEDSQQAPFAPEGSAEAIFAKAGLKIAVLDFRSLPKGIVRRYFNAPLKTDNGVTHILPWEYDAVLFIESTTDASPVKAGRVRVAAERLKNPSNLDFEQIENGKPKDWDIQGGQSKVEYQTESSENQPYKGNICGMIKRVPGRAFGGSFGNIRQSVKASDFKGKSVQFNAAARVDGGTGYLWLSIDVINASNIFRQQIVTSDKWQEYHIEIEVPQKATKITYGLAYVGQGAAFIDDVSISVITGAGI